MKALDTLMRTGYFACEFDDPLAALITKHNIAGFIGKRAVVPGLSKELSKRGSTWANSFQSDDPYSVQSEY